MIFFSQGMTNNVTRSHLASVTLNTILSVVTLIGQILAEVGVALAPELHAPGLG
jgi:hypothetical protein